MINLNKLLKNLPTLENTDVKDKTVIARLDLNVPIGNGKISNTKRIDASKKTIDYLLDNNCKIVILSHLSRVKEEKDIKSGKKSLEIVANYLKTLYPNNEVIFVKNNVDKKLPAMIKKAVNKTIFLLENTRYQDFDIKTKKLVKKESKCDLTLAKFWASLGQVFVNDAFGTIHREHASNAGINKYCKKSCIGFLIKNELEHINMFLSSNNKPVLSILGGAKVSDKIPLFKRLISISDKVIVTGGMSFTFLKALDNEIGTSKYEPDMIDEAKQLLELGKEKIILPIDFVATKEFADIKGKNVKFNDSINGLMGLDTGRKTNKIFKKLIMSSKAIFWNGPSGVFEFKNYEKGTKTIANAIIKATSKKGAFSLIGGGDTVSAALKYGNEQQYSFISTGGGASLAVIQGENLPSLIIKNKK